MPDQHWFSVLHSSQCIESVENKKNLIPLLLARHVKELQAGYEVGNKGIQLGIMFKDLFIVESELSLSS